MRLSECIWQHAPESWDHGLVVFGTLCNSVTCCTYVDVLQCVTIYVLSQLQVMAPGALDTPSLMQLGRLFFLGIQPNKLY